MDRNQFCDCVCFVCGGSLRSLRMMRRHHGLLRRCAGPFRKFENVFRSHRQGDRGVGGLQRRGSRPRRLLRQWHGAAPQSFWEIERVPARTSAGHRTNPKRRAREVSRRWQRRNREFSASAKSRSLPRPDATAIAAVRSASSAVRASPARHERCDSPAPSAHAGFSAAPRRFSPGYRAAAGCLYPWPRAASWRDHTREKRKRASSRRRENRRSRSECPLRRGSPRQLRRATGRECGRTARADRSCRARRWSRRCRRRLPAARARSASGSCSADDFGYGCRCCGRRREPGARRRGNPVPCGR